MSERFYWTVEFVPDVDEGVHEEFDVIGTLEEAKAEAERRERDYLRQILFHRKGRSSATEKIVLA